MSDTQKRALRTLVQAVLGALGTGLLDIILGGAIPNKWLPIITVILTTILTAVQNALEESHYDNVFLQKMRATK